MSSLASSTNATNGGIPNTHVDIPVCAVLMAFYLTGSVSFATIFFRNQSRKHKFFLTWLCNVFCIIRLITMSMRIVWAKNPTNFKIAIAAQVFNSAGVLFAYIINLLLAQRILRSRRPQIGWNKGLGLMFKVLYGGIISTLIMGITGLVISINTKNPSTLRSVRDVTLATSTFIVFVAVLPLFIILLAHFSSPSHQHDVFGTGSIQTKSYIVITTTCLTTIIAGYKCGTTWDPPRPISRPGWYQSKAAFYCFNFVPEILLLTIWLFTRIDKRFHVPNKSKGPGDYSTKRNLMGASEEVGERDASKEYAKA